MKVKGYYIKLLLIAENNTIPLTNIEIANKLGISKNTVFKYNIELFQAGLLKLFPDRLELTPNEVSKEVILYLLLIILREGII